MGLPLLPDEILLSLAQQWPCRETQLRQIASLLSLSFPNPSTIVVHGSQATGKSDVLAAFLAQNGTNHAIIRCREFVTGRHLLETAVKNVAQALQNESDPANYNGRCESLSAFTVHMERLLSAGHKFILVFDNVDEQREAPPTLLPALARLAKTISGLTVVLVVQHAQSRFLHQNGVPHVHFSPYSRSQSVHIVSQKPPDIFLEAPPEELEYDSEVHEEDKAWLWPRFCAAVWDALAQNAARDLVAFRSLCHKLWRPFVAPIVSGDFGTRDFSRLLVAQRRLFQGESALLDSVISVAETPLSPHQNASYELPYFAKWTLVAAYLASFNPSRMDALYFMKSTERKRRKKGGGTARSGGGRQSQSRKIPRHLLAASTFTLDRLLAILHAILPEDIRTTIDFYRQVATLTSLKLLQRAGGIGGGDPLEPGGKWKVGSMVSWEYVQSVARGLEFNLADYVVE